MKKLMAGSLALIFGIILFSFFSHEFLHLCLGIVPVILIMTGAIAIYVSYTSLADELEKEEKKECTNIVVKSQEADNYTEQSAFWGNTQSMIFHNPECNFAQSKKCTERFPDKDSAISAGYNPCGVCEP